jgi:hypothetical protein
MTITDRTDEHGFVLIIGGKAGKHPDFQHEGVSPHLSVTPDRGVIRCGDCGVNMGRGHSRSRVGGYNGKGHRICLSCFHRRLRG